MKKILTILFVFAVTFAYAQRPKVVEGDLKFLSGQNSIAIEYDYEGQAVGKFDREEDYIAEKKAAYNEDEAGRGDHWAEEWVNDRANLYQPKFEELLTKQSGFKVTADAQYTLILKTTKTEPGFNVGIMRQPAFIDTEAIFVETANKDNVLARVIMLKAPGSTAMGYDFATGPRIAEAYAKTGKTLGATMKKAAK